MELEIGVRTTRGVGGLTFTSTETDAVFLLLAHLPGFGKDDIEIQINETRTEISVSGGGGGQTVSLDEVSIQSRVNVASEVDIEGFRRVFSIPDCVDFRRIDAEFDGDEEMLVVLMPKLEREEVATAVIEEDEDKEEQIREPEKSEQSDVDGEPDQSEMQVYVPEKKEEEEVDLNSVEALDSNEAAEQEQEQEQEEEEIPTEGIPHQLEAEEEELEEEEIPDVEIPTKEEEEEEDKIDDDEILTAEMPDQPEPEEKLDEEEIPTVEPPRSLDPAETMESEPAGPSKLADAHPEEEQDRSREIETADTHQQQELTSAEEEEIPPDRAPETETTDPHQDQEIPNVEAPDIETIDPSREQEQAAQEQEIPATETVDKVPEVETAEQELSVQDQAPETAGSQGREHGQDLKQEDQNAIVDQSSGEDSDTRGETEMTTTTTTMRERKKMRRARRRRMPLPPTTFSLVAGSAFIFSLVVLMFHFLKDEKEATTVKSPGCGRNL